MSAHEQVRLLVTQDLLESAIQLLLTIEAPQSHTDEVTLLGRRLSEWASQKKRGTLTHEQLAANRTEIAQAILQFLRDIEVAETEPFVAHPRPLPPDEIRARARYLKDLRQHLENLRQASLHHARFVDLGIEDSPAATRLLGIYRNPESKLEFGSIDAALVEYQYRMLLLGEPGGGKTTVLQNIALGLVTRAQQNHSAPVPVLVNLSNFRPENSTNVSPGDNVQRWRLSRTKKHEKLLETWLADEIVTLYSIPRPIARRWAEEGRIAALIDGLDEVNDERRVQIVKLLNSTYLRSHADSIVIVCSRIVEYLPLQENAETRLALRGAVALHPQTDEQVKSYLDAARAFGLKQALDRDESLNELARNPLMLSMMTLAYGNSTVENIPAFASRANQRHHLLEAFISRMLQRKERRDRGLPFDDNPQDEVNELNYRFPPEKFNRYMSWLAVRMSVQMQTAYSAKQFWRLLFPVDGAQGNSVESWAKRVGEAALVSLLIFVMAVTTLPPGVQGLLYFLKASIGAVTVCWTYCILKKAAPALFTRVVGVYYVGFSWLWLGMTVRGLSAVIPVALHPITIAIAVTAVFITIVVAIDRGLFGKVFWSFLLLQASVGAFLYASYLWLAAGIPLDWALSAIVIVSQAIAWYASNDRPGDDVVVGLFLAVILVPFGALGSSLVNASWGPAIVGFVGLSFLLFAEEIRVSVSLPVALATAAASLGAAWADELGIPGGIGILVLTFTLLSLADVKKRMPSWLATRFEYATDSLSNLIDRVLLVPPAHVVLAVTGRLPFRLTPFLRYGGAALILKPFRGEVEFAHRLLRDYFALRELVPRLQDTTNRPQTIAALGFQGDAAIEPLTEVISNGSVGDRMEAVASLGRVAAPDVAPILKSALQDPVPEVRGAVIRALGNIPKEQRKELWQSASADPAWQVQCALFDVCHYSEVREILHRSGYSPELLRHALSSSRSYLNVGTTRSDESGLPMGLHWNFKSAGSVELGSDNSIARDELESLRVRLRDVLVTMLREGDVEAKCRACFWMLRFKSVASIEDLTHALVNEPNPTVKSGAAAALKQWGELGHNLARIALEHESKSRLLTWVNQVLGRLIKS